MSYPFRKIVAALSSSMMLACFAASAQSADNGPLQLEAKILLGDVRGRIDHMAVDLKRQRLFVAELGNDSLGVVDLTNRSVVRTIAGLNEPQGVGYEPSTDTLYAMPTMSVLMLRPSGSSLVTATEDWPSSIHRAAARSRMCRSRLIPKASSSNRRATASLSTSPAHMQSWWWMENPESSLPTGR
jgi:YVTN family beta-propeller protein